MNNKKNVPLTLSLRIFQGFYELWQEPEFKNKFTFFIIAQNHTGVLCSSMDRSNSFLPAEAMIFYVQYFSRGRDLSSLHASQNIAWDHFPHLCQNYDHYQHLLRGSN